MKLQKIIGIWKDVLTHFGIIIIIIEGIGNLFLFRDEY